MDNLNNGRSAEGLPNDTKLHDIIISATAAVLNNQKTTLIRRLGSEKLKDSKLLRRRQDTIERFMAEFLPPDLAMLEAWNIARTPLLVLLRGPLGIETDDGTRVGELVQGSPYTIKEEVLGRAQRVFTSSTRCLVVENHTPFWEMAVSNAQDLIVHASYPSSSVVKLLRLLPATVSLQHWGDTDPWGYDILRVLREKTGRTIQPWRMNYRPHPGPPLSDRESAVLARLRADPLVADLRSELNAMFVANTKGDFEQDGMPFVEW